MLDELLQQMVGVIVRVIQDSAGNGLRDWIAPYPCDGCTRCESACIRCFEPAAWDMARDGESKKEIEAERQRFYFPDSPTETDDDELSVDDFVDELDIMRAEQEAERRNEQALYFPDWNETVYPWEW